MLGMNKVSYRNPRDYAPLKGCFWMVHNFVACRLLMLHLEHELNSTTCDHS